MVKFRKYTGVILLFVYAFFFASTNFFYHAHQIGGSKILHSHPFSTQGHSHTTNQIFLINQIDSAPFQSSAELTVSDAAPGLPCEEFLDNCADTILSVVSFSYLLRAPPASC